MKENRKFVLSLQQYISNSYKKSQTTAQEWFQFLLKVPQEASQLGKYLSMVQRFRTDDNLRLDTKYRSSGEANLTINHLKISSRSNHIFVNDAENEKLISEPKGKKYAVVDVQKFLENLRLKFSNTEVQHNIPKWKLKPKHTSQDELKNRIRITIDSLLITDIDEIKLQKMKELISYLEENSFIKHFAIKIGAVRALLYIQNKTKDEQVQEVSRETLCILGYVDPPASPGVRILSIDGGGIRGIVVINILKKLEMLTGKKIYELFDYICGVSTGAIITCCIIPPYSKTMDNMNLLYRDLSTKVFNQSALWGTGKLVWKRAYYDTSVWEELLKSHVGETRLIESIRIKNCPKISTVSTIINRLKVSPFLFRNYSLPFLSSSGYKGSSRHTIFEAVRASAAAPTIFEEIKIGDFLHQDGGIIVNNPAAVAIHETKALWPNEKIHCVVSCGTGMYNPVPTVYDDEKEPVFSSSWKQLFSKILDSATDTEAVHTMLNDLLPEDVYFRLNPHLSEYVSMDEIDESKLSVLENDTEMYCRRNEAKFHKLAATLSKPRTVSQVCQDHLKLQAKLSGLGSD